MPTVREAVFEFLRNRRMTTIFGNPGTTEVPFLAGLPSDFTYVLGLQESVVVGMADGFSQVTRRPAMANLHTAAGVGNAMGNIYNAKMNKAPVVVTAGQQVRRLLAVGAHLASLDATQLPRPLVKWSYEPARPEDVPHAIVRATNVAGSAPKGPALISIPADDWQHEADINVDHHIRRTMTTASLPAPDVIKTIAADIRSASRPALVAGPEIDVCGAWELAIRLATHLDLPVFAAPASGAERIGFPEDHPLFAGILPLSIAAVGETLKPYDYVLVLGSSTFAYYIDEPGPALAPSTRLVAITSDEDEAARAPIGEIHLADTALTLDALCRQLAAPAVESYPPVAAPEKPQPSYPLSTARVTAVLSALLPDDAILVVEAPTAPLYLRPQLRMNRPDSYLWGSGGGLGWGLPASLGVAMASPDRPVVCLLGDGSAQYSIQGLWTAATYNIPVTFVVLRNDEYAVLKHLAQTTASSAMPGCDIPGIEIAAIARAYGVPATQVSTDEELHAVLRKTIGGHEPHVVEVAIAHGEDPSYT